jgi:tetratricopeptide (TPR) repeat protein
MAHEWSGNAPQPTALSATETTWLNRQRLRTKDRALIEAVVGPNGTEPSALADVQAAREHASVVAADRFEAWYLLADHLFHVGALLGIDQPLERAEEAFRRSLELDPGQAGVLQHLIQIAAARGDTAEVRSLWADYQAAVPDPAVRFKDEWLVGQLLGDTTLTRVGLEHFDGGAEAYSGIRSLVFTVALLPQLIGPVRELLERTAAAMQRREHREALAVLRRWLALDAGRPAEAERRVPDAGAFLQGYETILDEVFWGAARVVSAREMARMTDEPGVCALGLLYAHEGRWDAVDTAIAGLARFTGLVGDPLSRQQREVCGRILEAAHAQGTGRPTAHRLILSVDSLLLTVPYVQLQWENLMVARLLAAEGEHARAAAAASRFRYGLGYPHYMAAHLREGGRLAALAGDRERAVARLRRYLALRSDPEPAAAAEVAEVRAALDRLTAGRE